MENNTAPNKLDATVKESLSNYDATYDSGDWSRMERMLDAAPKSGVSKGSYNKSIIVASVVLLGAFLIYKGITSTKTSTETTVTPVDTKTEETSTPPPAPVVAKETPVVKPAIETQKTPLPEIKTMVPETKTIVEQKEKTVADKTKKEKEKKQNANTLDSNVTKNQKIMVMGNEPIFGDMIDSSKGIIHKTKEKESTKKAAVSKGANNVGLSGLMNLNADSIRKQKELLLKDTIH